MRSSGRNCGTAIGRSWREDRHSSRAKFSGSATWASAASRTSRRASRRSRQPWRRWDTDPRTAPHRTQSGNARDRRRHGRGVVGRVLPRRRSLHHRNAKPTAAAMAAARTNGARRLTPDGLECGGGIVRSNARVADWPRASVTVTETRYDPFLEYVCDGLGWSLWFPSPKTQRYVYGGVPPVTLAVNVTVIPAEPATYCVGGVTARVTAARGTFT